MYAVTGVELNKV